MRKLAIICALMAGPVMAGGTPGNGSILDLPACGGWEIRCGGNEPFWSLSFIGTGAVWTDPEDINNPVQMSVTQSLVPQSSPPVSQFTTSTGIVGQVTYEPGLDCSDGMSDIGYPLRIRFSALPRQGSVSTLDLAGIEAAQPGQQTLCCRLVAIP